MANAKRDANNIPTLIAVLDSNGTTITRVTVNPTNNSLSVTDAATGTDYGPTRALKDENGVSTLMGVSSADGVTPVAIYVDSSGNLLVQST